MQLKRLILRCKTLLERSQDARLSREKNLLLNNEFKAPLSTPNDVLTSSLDILKDNPIIWAAYNRGKNDNTSSNFKTQQTGTLDPVLAKIVNMPARFTLEEIKKLLSKRKMTNEKFMEDFYQFLLSRSKDGEKK